MTHVLDVPRVVMEYRQGRSVAALAREYAVDSSVIRSRLMQSGVAVRGPRAATVANLARDPGIRRGMGRPRVYPVNPEFFDDLTRDGAYIVGLMQADGSNQQRRGVVCITLKQSDAPLLKVLSTCMAGDRPLRLDGYGNPKLMVQNRGLSDGLARWGVVSPKTHTASTHPDLLHDRDYWRGVVDGDGTLCDTADSRRVLAVVGSRPICEQFLAFCQASGAGLRCNVRPHKTIFTARMSGRDATIMASVLYQGAGLALERKRATARAWEATA